MSATLDGTLADPQQVIVDLQQQLTEVQQLLNQRTAERDEALQRETAAAEVLQVINSSPGDLKPVFDAMLEKALRLCEASLGHIWGYERDELVPLAVRGVAEVNEWFRQIGRLRSSPDTPLGRVVRGEPLVHIPDVTSESVYESLPRFREYVDAGKLRTLLVLPLRQGDVLLGAISVYRQEVRSFSDKQIALLQNFAVQAVIAIENARLLTETREALEQQTATAEVLQVINSSPGELAPVFDVMLEKAMRLCEAHAGYFLRFHGGNYVLTAERGLTASLHEYMRHMDQPRPGEANTRVLHGAPYIHALDQKDEEAYRSGSPLRCAVVDLGGFRTGLTVPLRKDNALLGTFNLARFEVRSFSEKQIVLVQNFAAQAVIAMENARLLTETREALEQQTATAEVLQVINSSPGELAPVFDAIIEKAMRLCEAAFGTLSVGGEQFQIVAQRGVPEKLAQYLRTPYQAIPGTAIRQFSDGELFLNIADLNADPDSLSTRPRRRAYAELGNARSILSVPLRKDETLLGGLTVFRQEVRPFSDKQIALLQNFAAQAVIAIENARLLNELQDRTRDLQESLEYQTATSDVLQVISRSTFDLQPVLDAVTETSVRLCVADSGHLAIRQGEGYRVVATCGVPAVWEPELRRRVYLPGRDTVIGRTLLERQIVHVADLAADSEYGVPDVVKVRGTRTVTAVPLMREGKPIGVMALVRHRVEPFTERQIELVRTFADQAVIAIENTRLITETREALEQQTATAEVLQVINSSPGDPSPVFEAILAKAMELCGAAFGIMAADGGQLRPVATRGVPSAYEEFVKRNPLQPGQPGIAARIRGGEPFVHILDLKDDDLYRNGDPQRRAMVDLGGARSSLIVALRKDRDLLGGIQIYHREVRPFSDKQIALLQNFAAQAVVAMENARLITETREALEQQTATSEVLQVINSSPGDLDPVFDAILEKAHRLCGANQGSLFLSAGEKFLPVAMRGVPEPFAERLRRGLRGSDALSSQPLLAGERFVHIADMTAHEHPGAQASVELGGVRTLLSVPLRKGDALLGMIVAAKSEVRPYADKQIALLESFAAQAVIAIENARLITETREALEQQTATAEVLQVINSSPGDLVPVFDAMLEKSMRLCSAAFGLMIVSDGDKAPTVAARGVPAAFAVFRREHPVSLVKGPIFARLLAGEDFVHTIDLKDDDAYRRGDPLRRAIVDLGGGRTSLIVALRRDREVLGTIHIYRQEVRPFTDKQIALLQNFAAQAVIAMENARLITETHEALEQQTATAEVLQVINSSPGDLAPVFDAILEKAHSLCEATQGSMLLRDGELFRPVALRGMPEPFAERLRRGIKGSEAASTKPLLAGERLVHVTDMTESDLPIARQSARIGGARTLLSVPLRKGGELFGAIVAGRAIAKPFSEKQISLLENFAAQAVIAMENARLINETREALEQQTATAEVLQVINASPGDPRPVFDAILEKGMRFCEAEFGHLDIYDGKLFRTAALRGVPAAYAEYRSQNPPFYGPGTGPARMLAGERIVHHLDMKEEEPYRAGEPNRRALVDLGGARSALNVALVKDGSFLGFMTLFRQQVRPFSDKQIALMESFAAQAVIAMDNARLLDEIRQRQAELRVTFENMGDGVAMFGADLRLAAWNRNFQQVIDLPEAVLAERPTYTDYLRILAERGEFGTEGIEAELNQRIRDTDKELRLERARPDGRIIEVRRNAVPGGGFVLIYADVTERKRAESEIRAARDAAEKTLGELRAAQANLIQAEKMVSLGQLTAGIAHEIKNPLNFVNNFAGLSVELLDELKASAAPGIATLDDDTRADIDETVEMLTGNLEKIAEHGRRADNIVKSMLEHSRGVSGERRAVDLNALVEEALNLAYHGARAQDQSFNVTLERAFQPGLAPIEVAPQEMMRVFLNLFSNGFYAASKRARDSGNGSFRPTLAVATREEDEAVEFKVRDNGTGIPVEIRDKLFQPFFTTKPTGEGTGLGLSISYDIITQQHGGTITVESEPGAYTEFTIRLPRRAAARDAA